MPRFEMKHDDVHVFGRFAEVSPSSFEDFSTLVQLDRCLKHQPNTTRFDLWSHANLVDFAEQSNNRIKELNAINLALSEKIAKVKEVLGK